MNRAVKVDICGHFNAIMAAGTRMLNGLGGFCDFVRNAYLSFFLGLER